MKKYAAPLLDALAFASLALFGLHAVAWSIRLAFGLPLGVIGWIGFGFAVCGLVAHLAAVRCAPPRPEQNRVVFTAADDAAKRAVADLKVKLADLERRRV